ncbi:MAG: CinA family protein [Deltaproteobacteria bacterium]|jgi:PncC family amidohydrolase|nr:CinA family protein [Deltaproteobacteria bacterium]
MTKRPTNITCPKVIYPKVFGPDAWEQLWQFSNKLSTPMRHSALSLAVAESLTGGWVGAALTGISGSSDYFYAGITAYANEAKINLLGVNPLTLETFGAVSSQCAIEMAQGVRQRAGTDIGLSTTGIAGPTGGSPQKPVGLVFLGLADDKHSISSQYIISGDRLTINMAAALEALKILKKFLSKRLKHP